MEEYRTYNVIGRVEETPSVVTLQLNPQDGIVPNFIPGQFVNVLLPAHGPDAKSYTISNTPSQSSIDISVKIAGEFSSALASCPIGDVINVSEPYGYFYPENNLTQRVFIAGGIGVAPFVSILRSAGAAMPKTLLMYSNRVTGDVPFKGELHRLSETCPQFLLRHFITRESGEAEGVTYGRIAANHIAEEAKKYPECGFYLCGSIAFVRDMRLALKSINIAEEKIYTEAFF